MTKHICMVFKLPAKKKFPYSILQLKVQKIHVVFLDLGGNICVHVYTQD